MGKRIDRLSERTVAARRAVAKWIAPIAPAAAKDGPDQLVGSDVTSLRSLGPVYDEAEHGGYACVLERELLKDGDDAPLNVALTGHYGSGKSSVLMEVERRLREADVKVINLSMPSLGAAEGRIPKDGDSERDKTNLIQKEIVKLLLYRRRPSDTPASRYNRLDSFDKDLALRRGAVVGVFALLIALLGGLPSNVQGAFPLSMWGWIDKRTHDGVSAWLQWLSLAVVFALATMATVWVSRILQQRVRVTELVAGAGPAKVKLSEPSSSYFDEYLDEIVYFFQVSETKIVIFEDLDRFKDPHIFETLRELNLLLNNAQQTGPGAIRFVYAIRDSIFEQLDAEPKDDDDEDDQKATPATTDSERTERRRLVTTNRTKFFDLVVPMVPFISHRTSRDLMLGELASIPSEHMPSREVVDLVSAHITDMRLIKNIVNEYEIFRTRILRKDGLKELTPNNLFASIVYKNQFLIDYEDIRNGTSLLDDVYRGYRQWVAQLSAAARLDERRARNELRRMNAIGARSARLGARLDAVLKARADDGSQFVDASWSDGAIDLDELKSATFWTKYLESEADLTVTYRQRDIYGQMTSTTTTLSFEKVQTLLGEDLDAASWERRDAVEIREKIGQALADQTHYAHASLATAMQPTEEPFKLDEEELTVYQLAQKLFPGADIVLDLLQAGHIDENFTLYVTQFPGDRSASAMNFILKAVQPNTMDIEYHFGEGDEASEVDIRAALDAEPNRILGGRSVYNLEIFDYLLANQPKQLDGPIGRLALAAEDDLKFINSYVDSGKQVAAFITLLSGKWKGVFEYVLGDEPDQVDRSLLDAALIGANGLAYSVTDKQRVTFTEKLVDLPSVGSVQPADRAVLMATALESMDILATDLARVEVLIRKEIVRRSGYTITLANLQTIMGEGASVSLYELKNRGPSGVYEHVISEVEEYLDQIKEVEGVYAVEDDAQLAEVATDIAEQWDDDMVEKFADACEPSVQLSDASETAPAIWPPLMRAKRFALSATNVASYLDEHGLDAALAERLKATGSIEPDADDAAHTVLALRLINEDALAVAKRAELVASLEIPEGSISPGSIEASHHEVIPVLVKSGSVTDDENAWRVLADDNYSVKGELIAASTSFISYMMSLPLQTNDMRVIGWDSTPAAVKRELLRHASELSSTLGKNGANGLAGWAAKSGEALPIDVIEVLASKGEFQSAPAILRLLEPHASSVDADTLRRILASLGGVYAEMATPGKDQPKVPMTRGLIAVLERLIAMRVVSKYREDSKKREVRVYKHHS